MTASILPIPQLSNLEQAFKTLASQSVQAGSSPATFFELLDQARASITPILDPSSTSAQPAGAVGNSSGTAGTYVPSMLSYPASQSPSPAGQPAGLQAVTSAVGEIGVPYVWGGSSPQQGFDCSGLVQWAYGQAGISLPRVAADQEKVGTQLPSLSQAQPGDLVFYGNPAYHVGIYLGDGYMVNAPEAGQSVQIAPVGNPTEIRSVTGPAGSASPSSLASTFQAAAAQYQIPVNLLTSVAQAESGMNPNAISPAGAEGLMQIMPQTASSLGVNPMNPQQAIYGAAELLSQKLAKFGSIPLALAAYNAGDGAVEKYGGIPPYAQTQSYVSTVMGLMQGGSVATNG